MISYAPKGGRFNWLRSCLSYYLTVSFMHELNSDDNFKRMQFIALYILLVSVFCSVLFRFMFCIYTWRKEEIWFEIAISCKPHLYTYIHHLCLSLCFLWNIHVKRVGCWRTTAWRVLYHETLFEASKITNVTHTFTKLFCKFVIMLLFSMFVVAINLH